MVKNISNLGDAAVYCDFGSEVNEIINSSVISYFHCISKLIEDKKIEGITNLTPSYNKLIVSFDLTITNYKKIKEFIEGLTINICLLYTSPSPRDVEESRMPSSA